MITEAETQIARPRLGLRHRAAAAFVFVLLVIGCCALWTAVPVGTLYLLGSATEESSLQLLGGLMGVPIAMALFAPLLFWLNGLYLRISGVLARIEAEAEETGWQRRVSGPLEPMLVISFVVALGALIVWFAVEGGNSSPLMI